MRDDERAPVRGADLAARVIGAEPPIDEVDAARVLQRVLAGVLDQRVEPLCAGRYVLLDAVGSGGLGAVYSAYDPELDRKVAIKLIRHDAPIGGDELHARVRREAQAMAKIAHANVVAIHDVGMFRDQVFIAMELVEGVTLRRWLADAPRDWRAIRDVLVQAGRGLLAVHDAGLVQRDFKPENVLVAHDGTVKLLDFGLARATADAASTGATTGARLVDRQLTRHGALVGTPDYMAPEQCRPGPVDARADQFAYCVTLFEALHGERPFPTDDLDQRLAAIGAGRVRSSRSDAPAWMRAAVLRGLAADPASRFASMRELLAALQQDLRRRRTGAVTAGVAAISAVATAAAIAWWPRPITEAERAEMDGIVAGARQAAREHRYVYPNPEAPRQPTAYSSTVALEHLAGPIAALADEQAAVLRDEFSDELVALGDEYAAIPGGAPFAADFFAAAVLFDPDNEAARARSQLTPPELASLRARAAALEFDAAELAAAAPLAALAEPDLARRREAIDRVLSESVPSTTIARLERVVARPREVPPAALPSIPTTAIAAPIESRPAPLEPTAAIDPPPSTGSTRAPDVAGAEGLVGRGLAALRRRELVEAEALLHRAAAEHPRSVTVLTALSTLYFELGKYARAVEYGELAVRAGPRSAAAALALGDAYFKVLRYQDARASYAAADDLGSREAAKRLARVDDKLAGSAR